MCMYTYIYIYTHTSTHIHVYTYTHTHIHTYKYVYIYSYIYICIHIYIYNIYIYIYHRVLFPRLQNNMHMYSNAIPLPDHRQPASPTTSATASCHCPVGHAANSAGPRRFPWHERFRPGLAQPGNHQWLVTIHKKMWIGS